MDTSSTPDGWSESETDLLYTYKEFDSVALHVLMQERRTARRYHAILEPWSRQQQQQKGSALG